MPASTSHTTVISSQQSGSSIHEILLLILLADTPVEPVLRKHGDYHDIFASLFRRALEAHPSPEGRAVTLTVQSYDVVNEPYEYPSEEELSKASGLLITGSGESRMAVAFSGFVAGSRTALSGHSKAESVTTLSASYITADPLTYALSAASAYEDKPWILRLVDFTASLPKRYPMLKLVGICYGHQIIARASGGKVEKNDKGWELGVRSVKLSEAGKKFLLPRSDSSSETIVSVEFAGRRSAPPPFPPYQETQQLTTVSCLPALRRYTKFTKITSPNSQTASSTWAARPSLRYRVW